MRPKHEVAQVISAFYNEFLLRYNPGVQIQKTLRAIRACRTESLGGHLIQCSCCNHQSYLFNSCRNRHCPKCQDGNKEQWIQQRENELLPVAYYHIVFTVPHCLNTIALSYPKEFYNALFEACWKTIHEFALNPKHLGAEIGMTTILHTWGQQLNLHPHLHCIVPAGGVSKNGKWKHSKSNGKYLFPKSALQQVFRGKFMANIRAKGIFIPQNIAKQCFVLKWNIDAKQPFLGPKQVIEYLGRYTHKIAISNHRIKDINYENKKISFSFKNYTKAGIQEIKTLDVIEFLKRFSLHVLPAKFVRIRHYGMLSSRNKAILLNQAKIDLGLEKWTKQPKLNAKELLEKKYNVCFDSCPLCKEGVMLIILPFLPNKSPPLTC